MRKATAIYHAPEGDNKVCEMGGVTFYDGQSVEINDADHPHLMSKIEGNQHFEVEMGEDDGEPVKPAHVRDLKAGISEAADHDFEADRRNGPKKRGRKSNAEKAAEAEAAEREFEAT